MSNCRFHRINPLIAYERSEALARDACRGVPELPGCMELRFGILRGVQELATCRDSELIEEIPGFLLCLSVSLFWWSLSGIEGRRYSRYSVEDLAYVRS
jgi:hypothetical protein